MVVATPPPDHGPWDQYARYAAEYYIAARFAALAGYMPTCANLMHHAIEYLLKSGIIKAGGVPGGPKAPTWVKARLWTSRTLAYHFGWQPPRVPDQVDEYLRRKFRHRLKKAWKEFKRCHPSAKATAFDSVIASLDRWEDIRYPSHSYAANIEFMANPTPLPPPSGPGMFGVNTYTMNVEECDRLFKQLWIVAGINPIWFRRLIQEQREPMALTALEKLNSHLL